MMSNSDNTAQGMTTYYHNTLGIQNWCANGTPNLNWYENGDWAKMMLPEVRAERDAMDRHEAESRLLMIKVRNFEGFPVRFMP